MSIRHREVAVSVIFDQPTQSFLLCHNKRWNGYAFPMKHFEPGSGIAPADVALKSLDDWYVPLSFPDATATPLDYMVETLWSDAAREVTVYEYHSFKINSGLVLPNPLPPDLRLFAYDQLQDAVNVTSSTKAIARSFVEDRKVAVAVVVRRMPAGCEFLLVYNKNHGYFFPSTRIKSGSYPAESALEAARIDLGYDGPLKLVDQSPELPAMKVTTRFAPGNRRFHYHLTQFEVPDVNLTAPGNALETQLDGVAASLSQLPVPYWRWFTEDEMRSDTNISPSISAVLLTALQLVEKYCRK